MLPYDTGKSHGIPVGADSISARQPAAIHNRGEVLRLLPFLLPMATCTNAPGLSLCNIHINF